MKTQYITVKPKLSPRQQRAFIAFFKTVCREANKTKNEHIPALVREFREELRIETSGLTSDDCLKGAFARSVILDLLGTGWRVRVSKGLLQLSSPQKDSTDPAELKTAVRLSHQLARDDQLNEPSVSDFIRGMERKQLTTSGWHSIFSLMRDGADLASSLRGIINAKHPSEQLCELASVINPYIQLVTENGVCEHTGLSLREIWRYFRHTWVNSYKSLPGRSMSLLIRDAAAPNHPVIGIAALGSSVAQQRLRDVWVGWDQETMVETIRTSPSANYGRWMLDSLQDLIDGIYLDDLLTDGSCTHKDLQNPTEAVIDRLELKAEVAIKNHRLYPHAAAHKASHSSVDESSFWRAQAQTSLFLSKRCKTLAKLLRIKVIFQRSKLTTGSLDELRAALDCVELRNALGQLVRLVKSKHVGIDMMDIIVCGSIAPYNALLGGKLACMLLCSPEVVAMYRDRYGAQQSVIASSMKGNGVIRHPQLVLLGTTSLYGAGSSQYNRVKIPCDRFGGRVGENVVFEELGQSEGYGSYHFGELTVKLGNALLARKQDGRRVNSIFGEGVNPRMRKLREAFEIVDLPADEILRHRNVRIVYGVSLARNASDVLLGLASRAQYFIPQSSPSEKTQAIAQYWRERWLIGRIGRQGILEEVSRHTLAYPVTHGGRVLLPSLSEREVVPK